MKHKFLAIMLSLLMSGAIPVGLADTVSVTADVSKSISYTYQYSSLTFPSSSPGSSDVLPNSPDCESQLCNATIDTNYNYTVSVSGTDLTDGSGHTIGIGNMTTCSHETFGSCDASSNTITGTPTVIYTSTTTGTGIVNYQRYNLDIPASQYYGSYSATLTWTIVNQ